MTLETFPVINATLNGASAVLLLAGFLFIKKGRVTAHVTMMLSALVTSTAFLACYLTYHYLRVKQGITITRFPPSWVRPIYLTILVTHTFLAIAILPLIGITLYRAIRKQWDQHRRIASITFPLWFYVSVTGVVIYWMLYVLAPTLRQ
jgi:protein SCO1/2/putative membrane protein